MNRKIEDIKNKKIREMLLFIEDKINDVNFIEEVFFVINKLIEFSITTMNFKLFGYTMVEVVKEIIYDKDMNIKDVSKEDRESLKSIYRTLLNTVILYITTYENIHREERGFGEDGGEYLKRMIKESPEYLNDLFIDVFNKSGEKVIN